MASFDSEAFDPLAFDTDSTDESGTTGLPSPLRILWSNLIDASGTTLTPSSQPISVSNIRVQNRKRIWRGASRTETLTINLNTPSDNVRCVAITGHNLSSTGTILLERSSNGSSWTTIQTKTVGLFRCIFFFFSLSNDPYWRLTFTDSANANGYIEVGRVFLGDYWEPAIAAVNNWEFRLVDNSEVKKSIGGQKWTTQRDVFARLTFRLMGLNEVDGVKNWLNIVRRIGLKDDLFLLFTPNASSRLQRELGLYGRFTGIPGLAGYSSFAYDTGSIVFEESI